MRTLNLPNDRHRGCRPSRWPCLVDDQMGSSLAVRRRARSGSRTTCTELVSDILLKKVLYIALTTSASPLLPLCVATPQL